MAGKQSWCNYFGFQPFQCVVSFPQERVVFFEAHKKSPHLALDYILTPSSNDITYKLCPVFLCLIIKGITKRHNLVTEATTKN